jgi:protein-S-isoprenylcysteine O-methyltransferase Ste14
MLSFVLSAAVFLISLACFLAPLLPLVLFLGTDPFPGRSFAYSFFMIAALEKVWAVFLRMRRRCSVRVERDWTTVSAGLPYMLVMYGAVIEFTLQRRTPSFAASATGSLLYLAAAGLRYAALHHLGDQWSVHLDRELPERRLVTSGPYRFMRHPLYTGACIESIAMPLLFEAYWSLLAALLLFIPMEVHRAYFEERYLRRAFGGEYDKYRARTWAFWPLFPRDSGQSGR